MGTAVAAFFAWLGSGTAGAFVVKAVISLAISYAVGRITAPNLSKNPRKRLSGVQVMSRSAMEYTKRVYGTGMVSGPIVYQNLSGKSNQYLWMVVALTDHRSDDIDSIWFDGTKILKSEIDWDYSAVNLSPESPLALSPTSPEYSGEVSNDDFIGALSTPALHLWYYLGDDDQQVSKAMMDAGAPVTFAPTVTDPNYGDWTSEHQLRGITYVIARLKYSEETEKVWQTGPPDNIKALLKGCRVYDPRLDSTQQIGTTTGGGGNEIALWRGAGQPAESGASGNEIQTYRGAVEPAADSSTPVYGSGSHRTDDATTWEWSDNPALAAADYLTQVMGVAATKVDWESIAEAADDCDELVVYDTSSPQNTEKRFTINGAVSMGESHKDNLAAIQASMDGRIYWTQGKWVVRASVWKTPAVTITEDDVIGDMVIRGSAPKTDRFNLVRGFFIDRERLYETVEFPHVTSLTYQARDNSEVIPLDLKLPLITKSTEAQRIAYRALAQSNNQKIIELPVSGKAANLSVGDTVNLHFPSLNWTTIENVAPYSDSPSNWYATSRVTIEEDNVPTPSGRLNGHKITCSSSGGSTLVESVTLSEAAEGLTVRMLVRRGSGDNDANRFALQDYSSPANLFLFTLDYSDGSIVESGSNAIKCKTEVRNKGDGWYELMVWHEGDEFDAGTDLRWYSCFTGTTETANEYAYIAELNIYPGVHRHPQHIPTSGTAQSQAIQTARVSDWKFQGDGTFRIICNEDYEASYTDPAGSDYGIEGNASFSTPTDSVPAPTNLTATAVPNGIQLDFDAPPAATYDFIEIYESESDNRLDSPAAGLVARMRGDQYFMARDAGFTGYYWVRAVRLPELYSVYEPGDSVSTVTATAGTSSTANLTGGTFSYVSSAPDNARVGYRINGDTGQEQYFEGELTSPITWTNLGTFLYTGNAADLQVYMEDLGTGTSTPAGAAVDTWIDADTNPAWTLEQTAAASPNEFDTFNGTIKVRNKYTQEEMSTASVVLRAKESALGLAVEAGTTNVSYSTLEATVYAGIEFNSSGAEFKNASGTSTSFTTSRGSWLLAGSSSGVWVERSVSGDSLNWQDPGTGRHQLSTTRQFGLTRTTEGTSTATVTFDFYDAASGGNLLDSVTITIQALYTTLN